MKTFKDFILETVGDSVGLSSEKIPHDLTDEDVKAKINAVLGHVAVSEFLNPEAALNQIEAKLSQVGLMRSEPNSDDPRVNGSELDFSESSTIQIPFKRYGDIMGKSVDTPHDEIEKEEQILNLEFKIEKLENGTFKVYGSLV